MVFKKTVSLHTDVVGEATEILQSVPVVVVLDDILYSLVAVLIATTLRLWLIASSSSAMSTRTKSSNVCILKAVDV